MLVSIDNSQVLHGDHLPGKPGIEGIWHREYESCLRNVRELAKRQHILRKKLVIVVIMASLYGGIYCIYCYCELYTGGHDWSYIFTVNLSKFEHYFAFSTVFTILFGYYTLSMYNVDNQNMVVGWNTMKGQGNVSEFYCTWRVVTVCIWFVQFIQACMECVSCVSVACLVHTRVPVDRSKTPTPEWSVSSSSYCSC